VRLLNRPGAITRLGQSSVHGGIDSINPIIGGGLTLQELKARIMAATDHFNQDPVVHTWSYKLDRAA
jgi:hypothetical protein